MRTCVVVMWLAMGLACCAGHKIQPDASNLPPDATTGVDGSVPPPDALRTMRLAQTSDLTVATSATVGCTNSGLVLGGVTPTRRNTWYRVYDLPSLGITTEFTLTDVEFALQESSVPLDNSDDSSILIEMYAYNGTPGASLDLSKLQFKDVDLQEVLTPMPLTVFEHHLVVPVKYPAGSKVAVGIFGSDHNGSQRDFYAGSTRGAETAPGYFFGPDCAVSQPESIASVNASAGSVIINITGTY